MQNYQIASKMNKFPAGSKRNESWHRQKHKTFLLCITCMFIFVAGCQTRTSLKSEISGLEKEAKASSEKLIQSEQTARDLRVKLDVLQRENQRLEIGGNTKAGIGPAKPLANDPDTQHFALNKLEAAWDQRSNSLLPDNQIDHTIAEMIETNASLNTDAQRILATQPDRLTRAQLAYQTSPSTVTAQSNATVWATVRGFFSRDYLLLWVLLSGSFLFTWCVARHDFRHRIRTTRRAIINAIRIGVISRRRGVFRIAWSYRIYLFTAILFGIVIVALSSPRPTEFSLLAQYKNKLQIQTSENAEFIKRNKQDATQLRLEITKEEDRRDALLQRKANNLVNTIVGVPGDDTQHKKRDDLYQSHDSARVHVNQYLQTATYLNEAGPLLQQHQKSAQAADDEANAFIDLAREHEMRLLVGKLGLLATFAFIGFGLIAQWQRKRRNRVRQTEQTCPKCLRHGTLEPLESTGDSQKGKVTRPVMRCKECNYLVDNLHRRAPRLRIPTAGYTESGKTVWLAMVHREVRKGGADMGKLSLDRASSAGGEDAYYKTVLKALIESRNKPDSTAYDRIRDPLLFNFSDGERFSRSSGMLNLFDLGGEMTSQAMGGTVDQDRALRNTEGFLYFVDPTETDADTLNKQQDQLAHFCEEVRKKRGVAYHKPLPVPIAICITKLDVFQNEKEDNSARYNFIEKLGPATIQENVSLKEMRRRHQLFSEYQDYFFPGWELDKLLTKLVGGRFLFFPMSAVGFGNTGDDFTTFNFRPFGIVEPLLWLTHMNGYKVL